MTRAMEREAEAEPTKRRERQTVEVENKLVEDAIAEGLARLGLQRSDAHIEILDEGKGGFLGIGAKQARVRVSEIRQDENVIRDVLIRLIRPLDEKASVKSITEADGRFHCELETENMENLALLLGRRGTTLDAIQSLATAVASKLLVDRIRIFLDAGGFREKRKEALVQMATEAAAEVVEHNEPIHLEPMSAHDRKIIHAALQTNADVQTSSDDAGARRHVVILPASADAPKKARTSEHRRGRGRGGRSGSSSSRTGSSRTGSSSGAGGGNRGAKPSSGSKPRRDG